MRQTGETLFAFGPVCRRAIQYYGGDVIDRWPEAVKFIPWTVPRTRLHQKQIRFEARNENTVLRMNQMFDHEHNINGLIMNTILSIVWKKQISSYAPRDFFVTDSQCGLFRRKNAFKDSIFSENAETKARFMVFIICGHSQHRIDVMLIM